MGDAIDGDGGESERSHEDKIDRFDSGESFVMVHGPFLADSTLTDAESKYLIVIESWLWGKGHCWPGDAMIARRCGWILPNGKPNKEKAGRVGRRLEKMGRLRRVIVTGPDGRLLRDRIEVLGLRPIEGTKGSTDPANTPGTFLYRGRVRNIPGTGQKYTGDGTKMTPELDSLKLDPTEPNEFEETHAASSTKTTLFREDDDCQRACQLPILEGKLAKILDRRIRPKTAQGRITDCARWLATTMHDEQSEKHYCGLLQKLLRGELKPDVILEAFEATYVKQIENDVGVMGSFFPKAIESILSRKVTTEEMLEEHATLPMSEAPPESEGSSPVPASPSQAHWAEEVLRRVIVLLDEVAGHGPTADGERMQKIAELVQREMAGQHKGRGSRNYLALVEAVAYGYPIQSLRFLFALGIKSCHPQRQRFDISSWVTSLHPVPKDWLDANVPGNGRFFDLSRRPADALIR